MPQTAGKSMSRTLLSLAGFQVITSGRFWVIAEVLRAVNRFQPPQLQPLGILKDMAKITDNISALSDTSRETVGEQLTLTQKTLARVEARIEEYKRGETSTLKLLNDLEFARQILAEVSEKIGAAVI